MTGDSGRSLCSRIPAEDREIDVKLAACVLCFKPSMALVTCVSMSTQLSVYPKLESWTSWSAHWHLLVASKDATSICISRIGTYESPVLSAASLHDESVADAASTAFPGLAGNQVGMEM